jgi:preprotein translocase subunit SecA
VEGVLNRRYDRLLGDGKVISHDIDLQLERQGDYATDEARLVDLLGIMAEGQRLVFDRRTHRQTYQVTRRLNYAFLVGQMLQDRPAQEVTDQVMDQLQGAREVLRQVWGRYEWSRLAQEAVTLDRLDERLKSRLRAELGEEYYDSICDQPLTSLSGEDRQAVQDVFGWFDQNEATRQLLLGVISELWVDYLTRVEALRVSIGLEAYAQRDPLVQYKGQASEMFQQLLADIRTGVISRLFTFRPRPQAMTVGEGRADVPVASAAGADSGAQAAAVDNGAPAGPAPLAAPAVATVSTPGKKKRKRH